MKNKKEMEEKVMSKSLRKNEKGITLIALVVTIVVLIILAVISVNAVIGENGIIRRAEQAKILKSHGEVTEGIKLAYVDYEFEQTTGVTAKVEETKLASVKVASARTRTETFLEFLTRKEYTDEYDVVNVVKLLGHSTGIGNGDSESDVYSDIYVIEDTGDNYELNYYNEDEEAVNLWLVAKPEDTSTGDERNFCSNCECCDVEEGWCIGCDEYEANCVPCELCDDCGCTGDCEVDGDYCQYCGEEPCVCEDEDGEDEDGEDGSNSEYCMCGWYSIEQGLCTGCNESEDDCSCCASCGMNPCKCGETCPECGYDYIDCECP